MVSEMFCILVCIIPVRMCTYENFLNFHFHFIFAIVLNYENFSFYIGISTLPKLQVRLILNNGSYKNGFILMKCDSR